VSDAPDQKVSLGCGKLDAMNKKLERLEKTFRKPSVVHQLVE